MFDGVLDVGFFDMRKYDFKMCQAELHGISAAFRKCLL